MKLNKLLFFLLICTFWGCSTSLITGGKVRKQDWNWKLSMQSYTFHLFSVVESLDKTKDLGLNYIEIYPGQKMGEGFGNSVFGYNLTKAEQEQLKKLAKSKNIKIVSSGVWTPTRKEWDKVLSFAKNMEMEFISAEPERNDWDVVEKLAKQYGIKVAVHNHPNVKSYWKPEILLEYIGERSLLLGSCADVGHFKRMGIEPIPTLRKLDGRLIALHFKDITPNGRDENKYDDVVWGAGVLNIKGMLDELKCQKFKGYFTIEYEAEWSNNIPSIRKSIDYFNNLVKEF